MEKMNEITSRVDAMSAAYRRLDAVVKSIEEALETLEGARADLDALRHYQESGQWLKDFEADEAGLLPADLKRGVLSEDGVYDVLSDHYALTVRLLDTVSSILKNR